MGQASSARPKALSGRKSRAVAFDSSFLMAVMERPTPWKEDIQQMLGAFTPVVLYSVRDELSRLASKGDKKGRSAALALELIERGAFSLEPDGKGKPDDEIVSFALREGAAAATIDTDLAARLRASRVSVIALRAGRVFSRP